MKVLGAVVSFFLSANQNVDLLKQRLQFGYEAADEARSFLQEKKYQEAAASFADALNLGRKPAIELQELDDLPELRDESLQWLIDVCCESSSLQLNHLEDLDAARADAWAACVFSKYQAKRPLDCMMKVCKEGKDLFGEFQTCKQMLDLPRQELGDKAARAEITQRIEQIEQELSNTD